MLNTPYQKSEIFYSLNNKKIINLTQRISNKNEITDEFFCSNCKYLINEPYEAECEHIFCKFCREKLNSCPIDISKTSGFINKKKLQEKIYNIKLTCPFDNNCNWENTLKDLDKHYEFCCNSSIKIEDKIDNLYKNIDILKNENTEIKKCYNNLQEENDILKKRITDLENYFTKFLYTNSSLLKGTNNEIKRQEIDRKFLDKIKDDIKKNSINLNDLEFGTNYENMKYLEIIMKDAKNIKSLYLRKNQLGSNINNFSSLSNIIKNNISIEELNLDDNQIGCNIDNMIKLEKGFQYINNIKEISLSDNQLGKNSDNLKYLTFLIKNCSKIKIVNLRNNFIGIHLENIKQLTKIITENKINELWLHENDLGKNFEVFKIFCNSLKNNKSVKVLYLDNNQIGSNIENMKNLITMLKENKTLKEIDIYDNDIDNFPYEKELLKKIADEKNISLLIE